MPETPLITYLRIQRATDREILAAVRRAAASVDVELRRLQARTGVGAEVRREQLLHSQAAINRRLESLFSEAGDITQAGRAAAAAAGAESILSGSQRVLERILSPEDYQTMLESVRAGAVNNIENMMQRVNGTSYVPLAQSVWGNQARSNATVGKLVNDALARGASAAELARDVRQYVNPNTPGGVRYASMRLARTELNNAFHAAQVKQAQEEPWTTAVRWHLSGSHPRPDACNDYADDVHMKNGQPGLWDPDEVPAKPHPNCLCYTTPETPDPEDFINSYMDGRYDPYMKDLGMPEDTLSDLVTPPAAPDVHRVGTSELAQRMQEAEKARKAILDARYDKKGHYNIERGWNSAASRSVENYSIDGIRYNEFSRDPVKFAATHEDWEVEFYAEDIERLDPLIAKNPIDRDITVARGVMHDVSDLKVGDYIADPGYLSTSTDLQTAVSFASNSRYEAAGGMRPEDYIKHVAAAQQDGWIFITNVPKGTGAIYADESQYELVLGRGTRQKVTFVDPATRTIYTDVV